MHHLHRILRPISKVLIFAQLSLALQPLSVLAKEPAQLRAEAIEAVRKQAARDPLLARKLGLNPAQTAPQAPSSSASDPAQVRLQRIEALTKRLSPATFASPAAKAAPAAPSTDKQRLAAIGPDLQIEVDQSATPSGSLLLKGAPRNDAQQELRKLLSEQRQQQARQLADFNQTRSDLQKRNLSVSTRSELLARHDAAYQQLKQRSQQFDQLASAVQRAKDDSSQQAATTALAQFFQQYPASRTHTPSDPKALPWGSPSPQTREPYTQPGQYKLSRLFGRPVMWAQAGSGTLPGFDGSPALGLTPGVDDLAATEDVQLSPAILAKATELNKDPVKIYNWVRNHIEFIPSYGSIQGGDLTLQNGRGNAFDTASLLIALLRASGIYARYVYGTIQLPIEQAKNWVGGVTSPAAVQSLMGQGGIPNKLIASGGQITHARLEHVWVEAWVDYIPSRGAKHLEGDSWVPMDASYKQYSVIPSLLPADLTANLQSVAETYALSGTNSGDGRWTTGRDPALISAAVETIQTKVRTVLAANPDKFELDQLIGGRSIKAQESAILLGSLPYSTLAVGGRMASLPESLRVRAKVELYTPGMYGEDGNLLLSKSLSVSALGYQSLNLTFAPASPADAALRSSYADATSFPAYLARAKAQLNLEGAKIAESGSIGVGDNLQLRVTFEGPLSHRTASFYIAAGDEIEIGINGAGQTPQQGLTLKDRTDLGSAAGNMFVTAKAYWTQQDYQERTLGQLLGVGTFRLPSVGTFSVPLSVISNFGIKTQASYHSRQVDIKLSHLAAAAFDGDAGKTRQFVQQAGMVGSIMEGTVIEQVFGKPFGHGSNTMRLLELANNAGMPIYHVTGANAASVLPELAHSPEVMADIANALNAGQEVVIPKGSQTNGKWSGSAYIMLDPETGSGDYRVNGLSGNFDDDCNSSGSPIKVLVPNISFLFFMLLGFMVDDDFDFNAGGVVALATVAVLAGILLSGLAVGVLAGTALTASATGMRAALTSLAAFFGMSSAAFAEDGDVCSCELAPKARKGGHVFHNICANKYNDSPFNLPEPQGRDVLLKDKHFDAFRNGSTYEIKTGLFYSTLTGLLEKVPGKQVLMDKLIEKAVLEFQYDRAISESCKFEFGYGVRDPNLLKDLQQRFINAGFPQDASRVFMNGC